MPEITITFLPDNVSVTAQRGESLLRAAHAAGVHINSSCGGQGTCGKCRILIKSGSVQGGKTEKISDHDYEKGYRLACLCHALEPLAVEIPPESRLHRGVLDRKLSDKPTGRLAPTLSIDALKTRQHRLLVEKKFMNIDPPTIENNASDLSRTLRALKKQHTIENIALDYHVIQKLARTLREGEWNATATLLSAATGLLREGPGSERLINIEPGNTAGSHYAIAVDVGTTTVCAELLDMNRQEAVAEASDYNRQMKYGDDVISRIVYTQKDDGLHILQKAVADTINGVIDVLIKKQKIDRQDISHITVSGNSVMTHILCNLDPRYIRTAPYTPTINTLPPVKARELGINLGSHAYLSAVPLVASYVGGDIVSGVLASGLYRRKRNTLFIDIGTNGEIVVGNREWLVTASCSAGPAFEGGGIRHGMRAADGAIEEIRIDPDTCEPVVFTIGEDKPKGICGSGIINIVAELLEAGILDQKGKFKTGIRGGRVRRGSDGMEYLLVPAEKSGIDGDIVITEVDIDNFMRAKGAMYAGYQTLLESVGLAYSDLDEVIIAGAFGSYIDIEKSIIVGLLPDLPTERFSFIGNSSLAGAKLVTLSPDLWDDAMQIAGKMTNFELSDNKSFMDYYIASLFFPHTEIRDFPTVMERLRNIEKCAAETQRHGDKMDSTIDSNISIVGEKKIIE
ncbi:MAG: hypothetical protein A2W19_02350 [Spirochaetes bacterium RBG_16_49_21]|nr:MAG: hypothetical protein A2W19_02350 [Spirochaetes bacterium RBG_16_49_21]